MAYLQLNEDRFSMEYILKENCYYEESPLVNDKFLNSLTESEKMVLADLMGGATSKNAAKKLAKLNKKGTFLDLSSTNGDISKSKMYKPTKISLNLLKPIIEKGKGKGIVEAVTALQTCEAAMTNLEKNKAYFKKAYDTRDSANILAYQTIAVATVEFASIILINCTAFTENNTLIYRDPPKNSLMKNILYKNLAKFNDICRNNKLKLNEEFERKIEDFEFVHHEEAVTASALGTGIAALGSKLAGVGTAITGAAAASTPLAIGLGVLGVASAVIALVYLSRTLICYYYFKKIEISENLKYMSGMIEANGMAVNNGDPKSSRKVSERQTGLAAKLKKLGDALDNDNKQAQHNGINELKKEDMMTSRTIEDKINPDNRVEVTPRDNIQNPGDDLFI